MWVNNFLIVSLRRLSAPLPTDCQWTNVCVIGVWQKLITKIITQLMDPSPNCPLKMLVKVVISSLKEEIRGPVLPKPAASFFGDRCSGTVQTVGHPWLGKQNCRITVESRLVFWLLNRIQIWIWPGDYCDCCSSSFLTPAVEMQITIPFRTLTLRKVHWKEK